MTTYPPSEDKPLGEIATDEGDKSIDPRDAAPHAKSKGLISSGKVVKLIVERGTLRMIRPPNPFRLVKLNNCSKPPQRLSVFATFFVQGGLDHGGIVKVNSVIWGLCTGGQYSVEQYFQ